MQTFVPLSREEGNLPTNYSALFLDYHTPRVIFTTVHDVFHPLLQCRCVPATLALTHVDFDVFASVMDERYRRDKVLDSFQVSKPDLANRTRASGDGANVPLYQPRKPPSACLQHRPPAPLG